MLLSALIFFALAAFLAAMPGVSLGGRAPGARGRRDAPDLWRDEPFHAGAHAQPCGAADRGLIEYGYADAVRLAGHSCPTVATCCSSRRRSRATCASPGSTRRRVTAHCHPEALPPPPELTAMVPALLAGSASPSARAEFGRMWQMRVKRILIDHFDDQARVRCVAA